MSKLENIIRRQEQAEKKASKLLRRDQSLAEQKKLRAAKTKFRKEFRVLFANLIENVRIRFNKFYPMHAIFTYRNHEYSIGFVPWSYEGSSDPDDYGDSGMQWALHSWSGGWCGAAHSIVYERSLEKDKDYSNEAVQMLRKISKF